MLTSNQAREQLLGPAMESVALGQIEQDLLHNARTPEVDSLAEVVYELRRRGVPGDLVRLLQRYVHELLALNAEQTDRARDCAGHADQLARDLGNEERDERPAGVLTRHATLRALREPLAILANPAGHDAAAIVRASGQVRRIVATTSMDLRAASLAHQLGAARVRVLHLLLDDTEAVA